uniref:Uncharacterized protein n=1 Tax=Parascaris equorum TaxID=6256 RepID=A0A914RS50_PAREQ
MSSSGTHSLMRSNTRIVINITEVGKETELGMSVDDIEHIAERGRWWLVGSAWQPAMSANTASPSICVQQENTS